jgi:hypothetical protein
MKPQKSLKKTTCGPGVWHAVAQMSFHATSRHSSALLSSSLRPASEESSPFDTRLLDACVKAIPPWLHLFPRFSLTLRHIGFLAPGPLHCGVAAAPSLGCKKSKAARSVVVRISDRTTGTTLPVIPCRGSQIVDHSHIARF